VPYEYLEYCVRHVRYYLCNYPGFLDEAFFLPFLTIVQGPGFDSRLGHWIFLIDIILPAALWPWGPLSL
jgi:hypothetical protein